MRRRAIVLGLVLAGLAAGTAQAVPATFVHGMSPYPNPGGCHGAPQSGTLFVNSEVEPWVGDDGSFSGSDSLIGTWQQDRFSSGGSSGLLVAFSHNGGLSWVVPPLSDQPAISNCQDPDNTGTNSDWERATDPWSDISPNGDMWFMSLSFNDTRNLRNAMLVSKSEDGGATWTEPVTLIDDANPHVFNDKNTLTADPNDSDLVYAVWDRLVFPNERSQGESSAFVAGAFKGPTYLSKTENGTDDDGGDWTTREILDLGRNDQTIGNQIAVLPRAAGETESTLSTYSTGFTTTTSTAARARRSRPCGPPTLAIRGRIRSSSIPSPGRFRSTPTPTARPVPSSSATRTPPTSAGCAPVTGSPTSPST